MSTALKTSLALLLLAGCARLGFEPDELEQGGPPDGRADIIVSSGDFTSSDTIHDGPTLPPADGPPSPHDGPLTVEGPSPFDALSVESQLSPCNTMYATLAKIQGTIAICGASIVAGDQTQCTAELLCNVSGGWKLCPASVYQAAYGAKSPGIGNAWIAGCVRDGNGPATAPTDAVCSSCASVIGSQVVHSYSCVGDVPAGSNRLYLGLQASTSCQKVGVNTQSTAGYWSVLETGAASSASVCCL